MLPQWRAAPRQQRRAGARGDARSGRVGTQGGARAPGAPMSITVVESRTSWQQAAEAIDRAAQTVSDIPGFYGYELAAETDLDLRAATVLMHRALGYLCAAASREAPRLRAIEAHFEARGELPPWARGAGQVTEDGD